MSQYTFLTISSCSCGTAGIVAGVVAVAVLVLLMLLGLVAGVSIGVTLRRRAQKRKEKPQQRQMKSPGGSGTIEMVRTEEEGTINHTYDEVDDMSYIDGREAQYQGLDVVTQDCVGVYTQLRGGTYQELDTWGREEEHHYQRANQKREGHGRS